ncbi:phosphatase PAP2 family protein [Saccharicrinis sp. GN24d3]|uniref:phosphatase PAP2 family protein n=1 Tax=Saccharicrinis sp. GN24d3 TaxID=3458416 RepID=UPI00403557E4
MKNHIPISSKVFIVCCLVFALVGGACLFLFSKGELLLHLNSLASEPWDGFFQLYTHLGLGGLLGILSVVFLFIRYYYSILFASALVCAGIFTFLLKQVIFNGMPRPASYLGTEAFYHIIEGFKYHHSGSFPSGHTMTAFAGAFAFSIVLKKGYWGVITFFIALLVGVSRVYLCQHFFMDIFAGALIGTAYTYLLHYFLGYRLNWAYKPKLNSNLPSYFKQRKLKLG